MPELDVREAIIEDAPILADIYNHYLLNTHMNFDMDPVSADSRLAWLSQYNQNPLHPLFVGIINNEVIGYASSRHFLPKPA